MCGCVLYVCLYYYYYRNTNGVPAVVAVDDVTPPPTTPVTAEDDDGVDEDDDDDVWPIPGDTDDDPVRRSFIDVVAVDDGEPPFVDSLP